MAEIHRENDIDQRLHNSDGLNEQRQGEQAVRAGNLRAAVSCVDDECDLEVAPLDALSGTTTATESWATRATVWRRRAVVWTAASVSSRWTRSAISERRSRISANVWALAGAEEDEGPTAR